MSQAGGNGASTSALRQTFGLLEPEVRVDQGSNAGYIDVLGEVDVISPRMTHQLVRRKWFPMIYERLWRPMVSRLLFGSKGFSARKERQFVLEMLEVSPNDVVVDVGCGPGNYTRSLAAESGGGLVVGVDASEAMLAAAVRSEGPTNIAFVRADACSLPFEDGQFDAACSVGTIHMIDDPFRALDEMIRVLAPGGRLIVAVSCAPEGREAHVRSGVTIFARDEVTKRLLACGCVDIEQRVIGRGQLVAARKPDEVPSGR